MPSSNRATHSTIIAMVGGAISAITIALLPIIVLPEDQRSPWFWYRIAWAEFLSLLFWGVWTGLFTLILPSVRRYRALGGILPSLAITVDFYVLLSLAIMTVVAWLPPAALISRYHLACQVALAAIASLLGTSLLFSVVSAASGTEPIPKGTSSPEDLCAILRMEESRLSASPAASPLPQPWCASLVNEIRVLRERISFTMPRVGAIARHRPYADFASEVLKLSEAISALPTESTHEPPDISSIRDRVRQCRRQVDLLSEQLKAR